MIFRLDTLVQFSDWFADKIKHEEDMLKRFDISREKNSLDHFMRFNSVTLAIAIHQAAIAKEFETIIASRKEQGDTDEDITRDLRQAVIRRVKNARVRIDSRSSSPSANIDEDSSNQFYLEMFNLLD